MTLTGERLKEAMVLRGYVDQRGNPDQSRLAREMGVTQGAISKVLLGKTRDSKLTPRFAVHLAVPVAWLLGKVDGREDDADLIVPEEREWIETLRDLEVEDRRAILRLTRSLAERTKPPTLHAPALGFRDNGSG